MECEKGRWGLTNTITCKGSTFFAPLLREPQKRLRGKALLSARWSFAWPVGPIGCFRVVLGERGLLADFGEAFPLAVPGVY
jgi:hypothetical protein